MLLFLILILTALSRSCSSVTTDTGQQSQSRCLSLCTSCQSLRPARINQICSVGLLTNCGCPENALNLTSAATTSTSTSSDDSASKLKNNCPQVESSAVGFCPNGQQVDSSGCPTSLCRPPPGCPALPTSGQRACRLFCPSGFQTDAAGCPICRCRCADNDGVSDDKSLRQQCSTACESVGTIFGLVRAVADSGQCFVCVCRQEQQPAATSAPTATTSAASTPGVTPPPCLLRCPNSCGSLGYADGETRDERGCVRDCSCRCPTNAQQACPTGESCLRWEMNQFGCQVCSSCSQTQRTAVGCVTRSNLHLPNSIERFCPADCPMQQFSISEDSSTGCLTCVCTAPQVPADASGLSGLAGQNKNNNNRVRQCSVPEPRCTNNCGPHGYLRDSQGCLLPGCACSCPDLNTCIATCSRTGNFTVARDAYGCHVCQCSGSSSSSNNRNNCPAEFRCSWSCGHHGYETDPVTGCQTSCRCRCPRRSCGCVYGTRQDEFGCDSCECYTAAEYVRMPFPSQNQLLGFGP